MRSNLRNQSSIHFAQDMGRELLENHNRCQQKEEMAAGQGLIPAASVQTAGHQPASGERAISCSSCWEQVGGHAPPQGLEVGCHTPLRLSSCLPGGSCCFRHLLGSHPSLSSAAPAPGRCCCGRKRQLGKGPNLSLANAHRERQQQVF